MQVFGLGATSALLRAIAAVIPAAEKEIEVTFWGISLPLQEM